MSAVRVGAARRNHWARTTLALGLVAVLYLSLIEIPAAAGRTPGGSRLVEPHSYGYQNVTFTGNLSRDFRGPIYVNENQSAWGPGNNLSVLYAAYNDSYLFVGIQELITGNSLMVLVGNAAEGSQGTYNLSGLNAWGRSITVSSSVIDLAAVYFGGANSNPSGYGLFQVLTPPALSNSSPSDRVVSSLSYFQGSNDTVEIGIPLETIFPANSQAMANVTLSAFVVGSSGSWVGTGIPYAQSGVYNDGGSPGSFLVSRSIRLSIPRAPVEVAQPINVAIVFNDHQPVYEVAGQSTYNLPWTEAHATAEYMEQALILRQFPEVNVTYELSGSLLWQLRNISGDPGFNDSFIEGAYVPWSSLNTSQNQSLLGNLTGDWFSIPGYVFDFNEPAAQLYKQLDSLWSSGGTLDAAQYEDAKVLWFLYDVSTDLVEGRLGGSWTSPTIWALHNQTTFDQTDLGTILRYSQWLTGQVIPAFRAIERGNASGSDNTELFTSPFYHPLTPLLLAPTISGPSGSLSKGVYTTDVLAQINLSRGQFDQDFGEYPSGMYSSEAAVSEAMVPLIQASGAQWTVTDEWTLQQSGVPASDWGCGGDLPSLEDLYTPYTVLGANNSSTVMFFRDASLSDDWGFDYGNLPTATAVADILNYLKGIDGDVPIGDHPRTLVTLMLDGENWMFESPFADDGVPFLEQLYAALQANRTFIHTVTPSQFLASLRGTPWLLPTLSTVATGTWNQGSGSAAPLQSNISLTQWSGYPAQDWMWADLDSVRNQVVQFQQRWGLAQLQNWTPFEQNLTASTPEGNLTRAWYGIYNAEGSDWFFQMAPWTISGANTGPFNLTFQGDLAYALSELHPAGPVILSFRASPADVSTGGTTYLNVSTTGGLGALSYAYAGLPAGCASRNVSALPCTPTTAGNFSVAVTVTDAEGRSDSATSSLTVRSPCTNDCEPTISAFTALPSVLALGESSDLHVSAKGGTGAVAYAYAGLPPGCLTSDNASLVCTPSRTGSYDLRAFVNDSVGHSANATAPLLVEPEGWTPPLITSFTVSPSELVVGNATVVSATVAGGVPPLTYTYSGLPPGCVGANQSSWVCVPTAPGNYSLRVNVTDAQGESAESHPVNLSVVRATPPSLVLLGVSISPNAPTIFVGTHIDLAASPICESTCPTAIEYTWSLASPVYGNLSSVTGPTSVCTAGREAGTQIVTVQASYEGVLRWANASITITAAPCSGCSMSTPSPLFFAIYAGVFLAVVVLGIVLFYLRGRARARKEDTLPPGRATEGENGVDPPIPPG